MRFESVMPLGATVVGAVLVITALMKVAAPFAFYRHVARLDLKLPVRLRVLIPLAIGIEGAWGAALLVRLAPGVILPLTIVAFVLLTGLTAWSINSGKTADCGCYGGFITPSIGQSIALNGGYALLVAGAWATMSVLEPFAPWKILIVVVSGLVVGSVANHALGHEFRTGVALFTPSPLKAGQRWKSVWSGAADGSTGTARLVSYLGPDCPYCQRWVRALNVIHESADLPPVTGIMSSPRQTIDEFIKATGVRFPVLTISEARMQRLATAVPTTVLVENDVIQEVWNGAQLSASFAERFKAIFFPSAVATTDSGSSR
jgi:hypothetical protein